MISDTEKETRIHIIRNGFRNGYTMKEIATRAGISLGALNYFMKKYWTNDTRATINTCVDK